MKRTLYTLFLFAASVTPSLAQEAKTLTLNECRELALSNNKKVAQAKTTVEKQTYDKRAMWANFFPNFALTAADFYNTGKMSLNNPLMTAMTTIGSSLGTSAGQAVVSSLVSLGYQPTDAGAIVNTFATSFGQAVQNAEIPDMDIKIGNVFMGGISLTQPLFMGGKIINGYKMTKLGVRMAETNVQLSEADVVVNTDEAYILCIRAKELGDVASSYEKLLVELQKNVDAAVKHGLKTRNDQLKVQVKLNEVKLNLLRAENAYRLAQMNLAQVCGLPLTQRLEVSSEGIYELVDTATVLSAKDNIDVSARPEYSLLSDKSDLARLNVKVERASWLPTLALMAGGGYMNGIKFMDEKLFKSFSANVGVILKMPLWHFGEGINKVRSAKAQYKIAQLEQDELVEKMELQLLQAANSLQESAAEVQVTAQSVSYADANVKTSRQQYEVGTEPLSELLEAQAMWQQASASAVEARCKYLLNYSKYLRYAGRQ